MLSQTSFYPKKNIGAGRGCRNEVIVPCYAAYYFQRKDR